MCNCGRRPAPSPGPKPSPCGPGGCPSPSVARRAPAVQPAAVSRQVAPSPPPVRPSVRPPPAARPSQVSPPPVRAPPPAARPSQVAPPPVRTPAQPSVRQSHSKPVIPAEGINTALWGPSLWTVLHTAAQFTTTTHQRIMWVRLLTAMKSALPCPECTAHYNTWFSTHPLSLPASGVDLQVAISSWLLALHNDVNVRNGKAPWTLEQIAAYNDKASAKASVATLRAYMPTDFLETFKYFL